MDRRSNGEEYENISGFHSNLMFIDHDGPPETTLVAELRISPFGSVFDRIQ